MARKNTENKHEFAHSHSEQVNSPLIRTQPPEILAPAGDTPAALAALAAGADAIYLGLKHFSARMQAENFSTTELARLTGLAHDEGRKIYVAMNTLLKPNDTTAALRLIRRLATLGEGAVPDALVIQDPGLIDLARVAGFSGELHLSTLSNITHPAALVTARQLGASRVVLPRELSLDEAKAMDAACPPGLTLEMFVHGALCYCVSGRCWWSSYMGGKSGLRGRCVQPCRRVYTQKGREGRFFSCLDLSLDVMARSLLSLPNIGSWKIEGRRKGPHYVYYVTTAYRLLRDEPDNPMVRKEAEHILAFALGRQGTRSLFLPHSPLSPTLDNKAGQTGSGLLCGKTNKGSTGNTVLRPRFPLLPKDFLRIGYEDEPWHCTFSVPTAVQEGTDYTLPLPKGKIPKPGTPVFLMDRKEPELLALLAEWNHRLQNLPLKTRKETELTDTPPIYVRKTKTGATRRLDILVRSALPQGRDAKEGLRPGVVQGLWLSPRARDTISQTLYSRISWWLPPVIWPDEEASWAGLITSAIRKGARHFVCNSPWQTAFFTGAKDLVLTAGPFCNTANAPSLALLASMGFASAIISPELGEEDTLCLPGQSPLPLGIVVAGFWPMGITRHKADPLKAQESFTSPKGESFWMRRYGQNTWLYPAWPLDLSSHAPALEKAGYTTFITLQEHPPKGMPEAKRSSEFNWKTGLL